MHDWKLITLLSLVLLNACATPMLPKGGPEDKTPPIILQAFPKANALNVTANEARLIFSEYLDQTSFEKAFSITPAFTKPLRFRWQGKSVVIQFPEPLRTNTTYLLQIETSMRDWHNVALKAPITMAFSTGAVLNRGELYGNVLDARNGNALAQMDVFAFESASDTTQWTKKEPAYRIQTDEKGNFALKYLPETPFFVVALKDRNRNRKLDANEPFAVPPFKVLRAVEPDSTQTDSIQVNTTQVNTAQADSTKWANAFQWIVNRADTTQPTIRNVRAVSSKRLSIQFNKDVFLQDVHPHSWALTDSVSGKVQRIRGVYQQSNNKRFVWLQTDSLAVNRYVLRIPSVRDSSENVSKQSVQHFGISTARSDTTQVRFLGFAPDPAFKTERNIHILKASQVPQLWFNQAVDSIFFAQNLVVSDTSEVALGYRIRTLDGTRYEVLPKTSDHWQAGQLVQIQLNAVFMRKSKPFERIFQALPTELRGNLVGSVKKDKTAKIIIELYEQDKKEKWAETIADESGIYQFRNLHEGSYRIRAYIDLNGNGKWDAGTLAPYRSAEPIRWTKSPIQVRPRRDETVNPLFGEASN